MRIVSLTAFEIQIPFRLTFRHALAARSGGHGILVRAEDDAGNIGFGECVPRSYVTGETPASVLAALQGHLAAGYLGRSFASFEALVAGIESTLTTLPRTEHAAFCALELALLDLAGRGFGKSVGELLGPTSAEEVEYSGVVSAEGVQAGKQWIQAIRGLGFRRVKFKIGVDEAADLEVLRIARAELGPDCRLRVDANCAWDAETALRRLDALIPFALEAVEQPVRGEDYAGLKWLKPRSPVPVIVDESLASRADADRLISEDGCHGFNLRISKCGGLVNTMALRELAVRAGLRFQLGAQVGETAILSAAGRHFASRSPDLLFAEGSFGTMLLEADIATEGLEFGARGFAPRLVGNGLGITIDPARVAPFIGPPIALGVR